VGVAEGLANAGAEVKTDGAALGEMVSRVSGGSYQSTMSYFDFSSFFRFLVPPRNCFLDCTEFALPPMATRIVNTAIVRK